MLRVILQVESLERRVFALGSRARGVAVGGCALRRGVIRCLLEYGSPKRRGLRMDCPARVFQPRRSSKCGGNGETHPNNQTITRNVRIRRETMTMSSELVMRWLGVSNVSG